MRLKPIKKINYGLVLILFISLLLISGCNTTQNSGSTDINNNDVTSTSEFNVPKEISDAKVGQPYTYNFQGKGKENIFRQGNNENLTRLYLINFSLDRNGILAGTPTDGTEGKHIIEVCIYDSNTYKDVCKTTILYVMSDIVTVKGDGDFKVSMIWNPSKDKLDAGVAINLNPPSKFTTISNYAKIVSIYNFPTLKDNVTWEYEYGLGDNTDYSHYEYDDDVRFVDRKIYPFLKDESINLVASIPAQGPFGGVNADANIDTSTTTNGASTQFDVKFGGKAIAACGTPTEEHPFLEFSTASFKVGGKLLPILNLTNTGTTDKIIDITVKGAINRASIHHFSEGIIKILIQTIPDTNHFYKFGDIPKPKGQYAEPMWGDNKNTPLLDIKIDNFNPGYSAENSSTTRYVLTPGNHMISFAPSYGGIYFYLNGYMMNSKDNCQKDDAVSGSLMIEVTPIS